MYAATVSEVDGVRLLDAATVERMTVGQTDKTAIDGTSQEHGLTVTQWTTSPGRHRNAREWPEQTERNQFGHLM